VAHVFYKRASWLKTIIEDLFCRPIDVRPLVSTRLQAEEVISIRLTQQQARLLRALGTRTRAAICGGGAGTGKCWWGEDCFDIRQLPATLYCMWHWFFQFEGSVARYEDCVAMFFQRTCPARKCRPISLTIARMHSIIA
jgi:hypothetical protein